MILWGWKHCRNPEAYDEDPVSELARLYRLAADLIDEGERAGADATVVERGRAVEEAARAETAKLHAGDPENVALWKQFMPHCVGALQQVYDRLDIHFDEQRGESAYEEMLPGVVADLQAKGLAVESEGALCIFVEGTPAPFMVRKSDGAFTYATSD